ncbi:IclR family transcriptional regulator [Streptomyces sp. NPDC005202]|uniref:IclR family transcriptional regulator n=1 Tax=Streptomyces sp. NPDC005202 TaxID=3157021 RepID=UPI0033B0A49D
MPALVSAIHAEGYRPWSADDRMVPAKIVYPLEPTATDNGVNQSSEVRHVRSPTELPLDRIRRSQAGANDPERRVEVSEVTDVPVDRSAVDGGLRSVSTALELLDCFGAAHELGVSEIARRLGVAKSTAHRLLTTLCTHGLVEKNTQSGQYRLGLHLLELGLQVASRFRIRQAALPLLEELRQRTGCTVHLSVPEGADVLFVERLQSLNGMQLLADVARRLPAHCTSSGKVMAAFDPSFAQFRRAAGFPVITSSTIRTPAAWDRVLDETRRRGVAISRDEMTVGLTSVAAPVRDYAGRARAAISIVAPTRSVGDGVERSARLVTEVALKLSRVLCL